MLERLAISRIGTFFLATVCFGMAACITTRNYEETLNSWKGRSEVRLVEFWGPPTETFNSGNHKFLVYQVSQTAAFESMKNYSSGSRDYSKELFCTTVFELFDGHVVESATKGNNCRR